MLPNSSALATVTQYGFEPEPTTVTSRHVSSAGRGPCQNSDRNASTACLAASHTLTPWTTRVLSPHPGV